MSRLFAGIDGGQSSTSAAIGDERGRILARGAAGPADEVGAAPGSTRLRDALRAALDQACRRASLPAGTQFAVIVAGISGYEGRVYGRPPDLPAHTVRLLHDAPVAHAGAFGGGPGVVAIAGTGTVVYAGGMPGADLTLGGWGFLFGDEGSAFWVAREALSLLMRGCDEGYEDLAGATRGACRFFGVRSLREFARSFYAGEISRERVAAFAPAVLASERFCEIAERGAERIGRLTARAIALGAPATVAFAGGVFADERFRGWAAQALAAAVPQVRIVEPRYDPAAGALLLAYREAGLAPEELVDEPA